MRSTGGDRDIIDDDDEVPAEFLCPISLQLMRDPVTLVTGITYDSPSILQWLASGHRSCPVTGQVVLRGIHGHGHHHHSTILQDPASVMVPNHTLERLIHQWTEAHGHHSPNSLSDQNPSSVDRGNDQLAVRLQVAIGRIVIRGLPSDRRMLLRLQRLHRIVRFAYLHHQSLPPSSSTHAAATVASLLPIYGTTVIPLRHNSAYNSRGAQGDSAMAKGTLKNAAMEICVEVIGILTHLPHLGGTTVSLLCGGPCLECITTILSSSVLTETTRFHAVKLLHRLFFHSNHAQAKLLRHIQIDNLIRALLRYTATHTAVAGAGAGREHSLHMLLVLSKAYSTGLHEYTEALIFRTLMDSHAIAIILELLLTDAEIETELCESALALLNVLVCRPEGLAAAIVEHVNVVPMLARKIMTVSSEATRAAINSLIQLIRGASAPNTRAALVRAAIEAGVVHRLLALLQGTSPSLSARDQAKELFLLLDQHSSPAHRHDQHSFASTKLGLIFHKQLTAMSNFLLHQTSSCIQKRVFSEHV